MKFKVGDKVRVLPSAVEVNIDPREVGKSGEITKIFNNSGEYMIRTAFSGPHFDWWIRGIDITLMIKPGQQLMFSFMSDVNGIQEEGE